MLVSVLTLVEFSVNLCFPEIKKTDKLNSESGTNLVAALTESFMELSLELMFLAH